MRKSYYGASAISIVCCGIQLILPALCKDLAVVFGCTAIRTQPGGKGGDSQARLLLLCVAPRRIFPLKILFSTLL